MRSVTGRLFSVTLAFIIALSALLPMVGAGTLATPQYVPRAPGDFMLDTSDPHFNIYYDSTRITDIGDAIIAANTAYDTVTAFFGPHGYNTMVILAANHQQYMDILNAQNLPESDVASDWGDKDSSTIVIESPDQLNNFTTVLTHQLSHIVMRTKLIDNKYNVPEWFSEGLAIYVSGELTDSSRSKVTDAAVDNKFMTVDQTEEILEHTDDGSRTANEVSMAYAQSGMLVEYIAQKYGNDTIKFIMQDYATSGDLVKAFMGRIGYSPNDLNADMKVSLKEARDQEIRSATAQRVSGYVTEAGGKPIANETIAFTCLRNDTTVFGKSYTAMTNASGFYQLNLTYGPFDVHIARDGFITIDNNITLQKSESRAYNVTMLPVQLAANTMTAGPDAIDDNVLYIALGVVNLAALALLGFVFLRTKK
jgi:hypothetical protein